MKINLPNQVTLGRLILALGFFLMMALFDATRLANQRWLLLACFWTFLAAALADVLDGLLARVLHQVTAFGRIVDPVVDKVMVCGAFVYFASNHFWDGQRNISGVAPWMVIVILLRELLVSAVRAHSESEGRHFGASWVGKLKMFVQSATVCVILGQLGWNLDSCVPLRIACVWATVIVTTLSAVSYVRRARAFLLSSEALAGVAAAAPVEPSAAGEREERA